MKNTFYRVVTKRRNASWFFATDQMLKLPSPFSVGYGLMTRLGKRLVSSRLDSNLGLSLLLSYTTTLLLSQVAEHSYTYS